MGGSAASGTTSSIYIYDPSMDIWTKTTSLPKINILGGFTAVDNKIYVMGGMTAITNDAVIYSDLFEGTFISEGNFVPEVYKPIPDTSIIIGEKFIYKIPDFTFIDDDLLTYNCRQGNGEILPPWLTFSNSTQTLSGTPLNTEALTIRITATDKENVSVYDEFQLTVNTWY